MKTLTKYEADKAEQLRLVNLRDSIQKEELMDAVANSIIKVVIS